MKQTNKILLTFNKGTQDWIGKVVYIPNNDLNSRYEEYKKITIANVIADANFDREADCWVYWLLEGEKQINSNNKARAWWICDNAFLINEDWDE